MIEDRTKKLNHLLKAGWLAEHEFLTQLFANRTQKKKRINTFFIPGVIVQGHPHKI